MTTNDNDRQQFLASFAEWQANRENLSTMEEHLAEGPPDPDDWEASDDAAVELLRQAADLLAQPAADTFILTFSDQAWEWMYSILQDWADKGLTVTLDGRDVELVSMSREGSYQERGTLSYRPWLDNGKTGALHSVPLFDDQGCPLITRIGLV